jgi:hypothetical protein
MNPKKSRQPSAQSKYPEPESERLSFLPQTSTSGYIGNQGLNSEPDQFIRFRPENRSESLSFFTKSGLTIKASANGDCPCDFTVIAHLLIGSTREAPLDLLRSPRFVW